MASQYPRSSQRDHSPDEAELITKEANDRRLRQAIIYLANHGDPDPYTEYRDRVDNINKFILGQYDTEGYSFDHKLYRRLRRMVKDQLREFRRADEEEAELFNGKGDDVEEINAPYRTNPREPSTASSSDYKLPDAIIRGTQRLYGGPRNEVEKWHKDFPPSLPFAGTFHMQEQERMKSNHDSKDNGIKNVHDSGSCFKLPHSQVKDMDKLFDVCQLQDAIDEFNIGNGRRELNKDYVPRIFLERIVPHSGPNNDFHDVICSNNGLSTNRCNSSASFTNSEARPQSVGSASTPLVKRPSISLSTTGPSSILNAIRTPRTQATSTNLYANTASTAKNRHLAVQGYKDGRQEGSAVREVTQMPAISTSPVMNHGASSRTARRGLGHPPITPQTTVSSMRKMDGKRKLTEVDDNDEEACKRPKKAKSIKISGRKRVMFALPLPMDEEVEVDAFGDGEED